MAYNPFTEYEKAIVKKYYRDLGAIGVGKLLPARSKETIRAFARKNGLKVSKEYRTEFAIRANKSWVRSEETRKKIGDGHRKHPVFKCAVCGKKIAHYRKLCWNCYCNQCGGSGNNNWKGGVSTLDILVRTALWDVWNLPIFKRDNFTCKTCGDNQGRNLAAHHIRTYKKIRDLVIKRNKAINIKNFEGKKKIADLIISEHKLSDGITLCNTCHIKIHRKKRDELQGNLNAKLAHDNLQPSRENVLKIVSRKAQRLTPDDARTNKGDTSVPVSEIVGNMK